jgi:SAM-dependent methyltransferase
MSPVRYSGGSRVYDLMAPAYELLASSQRIGKEVDALEPHLRGVGAQKLLDAGCAAGFHSLELARRGFDVLGIDRVEAMVGEARRRAAALPAGRVGFRVHDLREAHALPEAPFDAVLCLGNTISSVTAGKERVRTLRSFYRALRPGGLLILQFRDLFAVRKSGHTFPVRALRKGAEEWILLRRHDPLPGKMRFLSFLLHRGSPDSPWELEVGESLAPIEPPQAWRQALDEAGFARVRLAADLAGTPRRGRGTGDIVAFARRG